MFDASFAGNFIPFLTPSSPPDHHMYPCREYVGEWTPEDDPVLEHRNLFPHCPLVQGQEVGNVPIDGREVYERQNYDEGSINPR